MNKNKTSTENIRIPFAPIFKPTLEEFSDPMIYLNKIHDNAAKFGICKVIPPKGWEPPFCLDPNTFKFSTRIQHLREVEATTREHSDFTDNLIEYWTANNYILFELDEDNQCVTYYKLYKCVRNFGGYYNVEQLKLWGDVCHELKLSIPQWKIKIRSVYKTIILPYLLAISDKTHGKIKQQQNMGKCSAYLDDTVTVGSKKGKCLCLKNSKDSYSLLKKISKNVKNCYHNPRDIFDKQKSNYAFSISEKVYTLKQFELKDKKFKSQYFKNDALMNDTKIENEFWKIVGDPNNLLEVEYGADLNTSEYKSAFPVNNNEGSKISRRNQKTSISDLKSPSFNYTTDNWNLNNLINNKSSALSYLNRKISGVNEPWLYVGSCFTCFCWHVEDFNSYSINYLHKGNTKIWYGIPSDYAESFENCIKQEAQDLFDEESNLLDHLVTTLNPKTVKKHNVKIYKVYHHCGEFVITFPRAYHCGLNTGFNVAEAVNFALHPWIPLSVKTIEIYQERNKMIIFSLFQLFYNIVLNFNQDRNSVPLELITAVCKQLECKIKRDCGILLQHRNIIDFQDRKIIPRNGKKIKNSLLTCAVFCECIKCGGEPTFGQYFCDCYEFKPQCIEHINTCNCNSKRKLIKVNPLLFRLSQLLHTSDLTKRDLSKKLLDFF